MEQKPGKFIVIEGIDGSGKSTQATNLANYFNQKGTPHILTREPTNGFIGNLARKAVMGDYALPKEALALLFAADRAEHLANEIRPAIDMGALVLCDRYIYSNMAYQGVEVFEYNKKFLIPPDLTIFIDTDPEECTKRIIKSRDKLEIYDDVKIAKEIRARYLQAFKLYGDFMPVEVVDGNCPEDEVFRCLIEKITKNLKGIY